MLKRILEELRHHAPFTVLGAFSGIIAMLFFHRASPEVSNNLFYIFHPLHVVLSAMATASMYELHRCKKTRADCNIWVLILVGYLGAIGIATLSDSIIPYVGEVLLRMPHRQAHIGFIEKWWLINPLAIAGIAIAYFKPATKFPHAGHVLISTWASLFHMSMAAGQALGWLSYASIFIFLFLSVWVPCCVSDIAFPLLFVHKRP